MIQSIPSRPFYVLTPVFDNNPMVTFTPQEYHQIIALVIENVVEIAKNWEFYRNRRFDL